MSPARSERNDASVGHPAAPLPRAPQPTSSGRRGPLFDRARRRPALPPSFRSRQPTEEGPRSGLACDSYGFGARGHPITHTRQDRSSPSSFASSMTAPFPLSRCGGLIRKRHATCWVLICSQDPPQALWSKRVWCLSTTSGSIKLGELAPDAMRLSLTAEVWGSDEDVVGTAVLDGRSRRQLAVVT